MIHFADLTINDQRRFAFYEDGDGVILNSGFLRFDEAEHWGSWDQFVADYQTSMAILGGHRVPVIGGPDDFRLLCPDWVVSGKKEP